MKRNGRPYGITSQKRLFQNFYCNKNNRKYFIIRSRNFIFDLEIINLFYYYLNNFNYKGIWPKTAKIIKIGVWDFRYSSIPFPAGITTSILV